MLFRKQLKNELKLFKHDKNGSHCHRKNSYWQFSNRNRGFLFFGPRSDKFSFDILRII